MYSIFKFVNEGLITHVTVMRQLKIDVTYCWLNYTHASFYRLLFSDESIFFGVMLHHRHVEVKFNDSSSSNVVLNPIECVVQSVHELVCLR